MLRPRASPSLRGLNDPALQRKIASEQFVRKLKLYLLAIIRTFYQSTIALIEEDLKSLRAIHFER